MRLAPLKQSFVALDTPGQDSLMFSIEFHQGGASFLSRPVPYGQDIDGVGDKAILVVRTDPGGPKSLRHPSDVPLPYMPSWWPAARTWPSSPHRSSSPRPVPQPSRPRTNSSPLVKERLLPLGQSLGGTHDRIAAGPSFAAPEEFNVQLSRWLHGTSRREVPKHREAPCGADRRRPGHDAASCRR